MTTIHAKQCALPPDREPSLVPSLATGQPHAQQSALCLSLCLTLCLILGIGQINAQQSATTSPAPSQPAPKSAGVINDWLREQSPGFTNWDFGGQFRARFEDREHFGILGTPGSVDFLEGPANTYNSFLLLREKVHAGYRPFDWLSIYGEARDSSTQLDSRNPNVEADEFDLNQAFVVLGGGQSLPVSAKVGRQELIYGDERLIGALDWGNLGRVFDAAKLRYQHQRFWVDGFTGRVVLPDNGEFNEPNNHDWFSGVYASSDMVPNQTTDLYFLSRNVSEGSTAEITTSSPSGGATPRDIYTLGLRVKSTPGKFNGWDYGAELAGQLGNFSDTAAGPRLDHKAYAGSAAGGYTFSKAFGTPRLGLEYNYASGDSDPADGDHETFENLFPTNHKFYGFMDFFSWQNVHDLRATGSIKPLKKLTVTLDYHAFWLADTSDFFYQVNGSARRTGGYGINPGAGNFVGTEIDIVATYAVTRWASAQAGYGHFFVGDYVTDTLTNDQAEDADFFYAQVVLNF